MGGDDDPALISLIEELGTGLVTRGWTLTVAESCTGGLLAGALTAVPGSSRWFECGYVTYSAAAKHRALGVPEEYLDETRIVSPATAIAMARGALLASGARVAVAVTGIAGPAGGRPGCPVGTVVIAWAGGGSAEAETRHFPGDRAAVRAAAVQSAVAGLKTRLDRGLAR